MIAYNLSEYYIYACAHCEIVIHIYWKIIASSKGFDAVSCFDKSSNYFSALQNIVIEFRFKFHWNLLPGVQLTVKKPALVQVMAWRRHLSAPSHYMNQRWPGSCTCYRCLMRHASCIFVWIAAQRWTLDAQTVAHIIIVSCVMHHA